MTCMEYQSPFFKNNYAALAFSSSNFFIPYLTVTLNSIFKNSDKNTNYDIFIFSKDASEENKNYVINFFKKENISIRFIDVSLIFKSLKLHTAAHITIETYFRLIIPDLLRNFDRVLFLDSDLIITDDINKLYNMDMQGYPIGATEECLFSASMNIVGDDARTYVKNRLKLEDPDTYFQAGVLLFDIKKLNDMNYSSQSIKMANEFKYHIMDQDILNQLFNKNYFRFDNEWNWPPMQKHMKELDYVNMMSPNIRKKYLAVTNPKIIHYADKNKPWLDTSEDMAVIWWSYARNTPFYEVIIQRLSQHLITKEVSEVANIKTYIEYQKNLKKYKKYSFFAQITFGKRKKRHLSKRDEAKKALESMKSKIML